MVPPRFGMIRGTLLVLIAGMTLSACSSGLTQEDVDQAVAEALAEKTTSTTTTTVEATTTTSTTSTTPEPTTTTLTDAEVAQAQYEADVALIKKLWRDQSDAWQAGVEAGLQFRVDHNYRPLHCTVEDFRELWDYPDDYKEEHIVDAGTIERDDDWMLTVGPTEGEPIVGRVYIHTLDTSFTYGSQNSSDRVEAHTTIMADKAWFFFSCWE